MKRTLAQLLADAARNAKEERDFNDQVARVTAIAKSQLAPLLADAEHRAESGREITCPHCNEKFTVSWRTDDTTSCTDNDDDVNERDADQVPKWDNWRIDRLNALQRVSLHKP